MNTDLNMTKLISQEYIGTITSQEAPISFEKYEKRFLQLTRYTMLKKMIFLMRIIILKFQLKQVQKNQSHAFI